MRKTERMGTRRARGRRGVFVRTSLSGRMRGLLGRRAEDEGAYTVLVPCRDIHTFGMRGSIDVAFVDRRGKVLESCRGLPPRRRMRCPGACMVAERPASKDPWFQRGDAFFADPAHKAEGRAGV